jgi:TetR/AcrR family transcriptional regulator, regulator of autoinduction and epiphytic fitness
MVSKCSALVFCLSIVHAAAAPIAPMTRPTFQEQMFKVREGAIVAAVNRLLAEKGFDLMTVDAVAAEVGIGKASLYKHFTSKEDLAAAAMALVLEGALSHAAQLASNASLNDLGRLEAMARWAVQRQIAGEMPALPAQNPTLREAMMRHAVYMERLNRLGDQLGGWIESARASGQLDTSFPAELMLYTLLAKGCDPVVFILKETGQYSDEQIVDWAVRACFAGLAKA